jgi:uncharacterized cupin superfamily protein
VAEAPLETTDAGVQPAGEGWFVVNVRDSAWMRSETFGSGCIFEARAVPFPELGLNIRVLQPGEPASLYHRQDEQEDFLVLAGECTLIVDEDERRLGPWDFVHCPPGVPHVFVGAGDGPCVVVMAGIRKDEGGIRFPVSEAAARHGASVADETTDPAEAYARFARPEAGRPAVWASLPWAR